jgi:DNA-binding PadR family transcriptional regulator
MKEEHMAVTVTQTLPPSAADRIYTPRGEDGLDRQALRAAIDELARHGRITGRDERLLEVLREVSVLSLDQVRRLLWAEAKEKTAYSRLSFLLNQHLLTSARTPRSGMKTWGLLVRKVYALGPAGRLWLQEEVNNGHVPRYLKRDQVLHDLLAAEFFIRLSEAVLRRGEAWSLSWAGERLASYWPKADAAPAIAPDGLSIVRQRHSNGKVATLPFFVEMDAGREAHGRLSSDWGRKVVGYDRFMASQWEQHPELGDLEAFPLVAVITHGHQRLLNLVSSITEKRQQPVIYYLALWLDLMAGQDVLTAPVWLIITPEGEIIGRERKQRQSLLPVSR